MLPEHDAYLKYTMYGGAALGLAVEWPKLSVAYNSIGRNVEYAYRIGNALRACNSFQRANMTIHQLFYNTYTNHPDKVIVYYEDQEWTFRDMEMYSNKVSNFFLSQGYKRGDVPAVFMENKPQYIGVLLGLSKIGVTAALINTNFTMTSLVHCITVGNNKDIIFDFSLGSAVAEVIDELKAKNSIFSSFIIDSPEPFSSMPITLPFQGIVDLDRVSRA